VFTLAWLNKDPELAEIVWMLDEIRNRKAALDDLQRPTTGRAAFASRRRLVAGSEIACGRLQIRTQTHFPSGFRCQCPVHGRAVRRHAL
jgi:hypothetical protein